MRHVIGCILLFFCHFLTPAFAGAEKMVQRSASFDNDWSFRLDSLKGETYHQHQNSWKNINLPHDWSIDLPFSKSSAGGISTGHKDGGEGWYRKYFSLPANFSDKLLTLYFEGIYMESEIWLNGKKIAFHPYGYTSFRCNITQFCNPLGKENLLEIKVRNLGKNSRWYSGSGIYRHVWLISTDKIHLDTWSTFITTDQRNENKAVVSVSTDLFNETSTSVMGIVAIRLFDSKGKQVAEKCSSISVATANKTIIKQSLTISDPEFWSPDTPEIYTAKLNVTVDGKQRDSILIPFGIRTIAFSTQKGFMLNGKTMKLKGGCVHHDNGLLGTAAIDRAEIRKVELLKANGFNAVRCAHNPPSEKFLDACDRLGILVIDEAFDQWQKPKNKNDYHRFFDQWCEKDIRSMVLRDRNHPSVIMWSIGNEIQERADSAGLQIAANLKKVVRKYDSTRPVTAAINDFWDNPGLKWNQSESAFRNLDVSGYNYMWWEYQNDHKLYPERVMFGSESTAMERAINWDLVEANPYIIGDFVWTAIDYLGESGIANTAYYDKSETKFPQFMNYPWFNAWCGDIDICGNKKPQSLFRDVIWRKSKIEMLVHAPAPKEKIEKVSYWGWPNEQASWNWKGHENEQMEVRVFTRNSAVRLYLNNQFVGEKRRMDDQKNKYTVTFQVPYQKGILKAVGIDNGQKTDSTLLKTTGNAVTIKLKADRDTLNASPNDLAYVSVYLVDKNGNIVSDEDAKLQIILAGDGQVFAGNSCPTDMESFRSLTPKTFRGKALAIVRPNGKPGKLILQVNNKKLGSASISISVN